MNRIILAAAFAALLAGCQSQPTTQSAAPVEDRAASSATAPGSGASTAGAGSSGVAGSAQGATRPGGAFGGDPLRDPANILSKRVVYFDFDSFIVRDEFRPLIEAHGRFLASNRNLRMVIQGNTDERGSREYNIALAERRSQAVRRALMLQGAADGQLTTVSYGEERPATEGADEAAYEKNRRVEIVYGR